MIADRSCPKLEDVQHVVRNFTQARCDFATRSFWQTRTGIGCPPPPALSSSTQFPSLCCSTVHAPLLCSDAPQMFGNSAAFARRCSARNTATSFRSVAAAMRRKRLRGWRRGRCRSNREPSCARCSSFHISINLVSRLNYLILPWNSLRGGWADATMNLSPCPHEAQVGSR